MKRPEGTVPPSQAAIEVSMNLLHTNQTNLKQRVRDAGHGWMMLGCVAMLVIAIVLVATGVASVSFIFAAVMCAAMMAMMMNMMGGMGSRNGGEHR
jgi:hypothetical protein